MINISDKRNCCGCGGCAQACPVSCITMTADDEGFQYPAVDHARCIGCGACERACPILKGGEKPKQIKVYAAYAHDADVRRTSSSGGVFGLLAERVLSDGGAVFGAAFDRDWSVHHQMAEQMEDLPPLQGSKYVQSRIEDTYKQAEAVLQDGRSVLFTGTPCQIAGLKRSLKKEYERLYTVDIFCHGVPSPGVWERYLKEKTQTYKSACSRIDFRNKTPSWKRYAVSMDFENGEQYSVCHEEDSYFKLFISDICLRPSCYDCKFRESRSGADLTLGDAWGVELWMPHMSDDQGTSVVVVNSPKGADLWASVQHRLCGEEGNGREVFSCNPMYYKSVKPHMNRSKFFAEFAAGASIEDLVVLCRKPLWHRALSFAKRCLKKVLNLCGIRI